MDSIENKTKYNGYKLITKEDPYYIHKICGISCILSYIFHLIQFAIYGYNDFNIIVPFIHMSLHATTYIFHVLKKRGTKTMAMFIWEELRLHSLIFSWRACMIILIGKKYSIPISFLTMVFADLATYKYGDKNNSTVRGNHDKEKTLKQKIVGSFFSMSQLGATLFCFGSFQNDLNYSLVFQTLMPIQTSAFALTLLRKNIINKKTWQIVYTFQLLTGYIMWYLIYGNLYIIPYVIILYLLRIIIPSKYVLWIIVVSFDHYLKNY